MRRWFVSGAAAGMLFLFAAWASPASGQTVTVTTCTNAGVQAAIAAVPSGGTITFACGGTPLAPTVITIGATLTLNAANYTLDGGGAVILAGNGSIGGPILQFTSSTNTVRNLTLTGGDGGAVLVQGTAPGNTAATFVNTTIYNNNGLRGGGIAVVTATATIVNSTFSGNQAIQLGNDLDSDAQGAITVENSIFLDGCGSNGGSFTDNGGNVATDGSCGSTNGVMGSVVGVTAAATIGAVVDGLFLPLVPGSAAIGLDTTNCPVRDELGNPRGTTCNAGAVQVNRAPYPVPASTPAMLWLGALLLGATGWMAVRRA